jgi:hypothetical protein
MVDQNEGTSWLETSGFRRLRVAMRKTTAKHKGGSMRRTAFISTVAIAAVVAIALTEGRFAEARPNIDTTDAYALVDPNANGPGNPGFVFQQNMASVRRVGTGRYCLRASVHFDEGPVALTTVDGSTQAGRFAIAVSDLRARYCSRRRQEAAVATFIIINGHARPSNRVRFVGDTIG